MKLFSWFKPSEPPSRQFIVITTLDTGREIQSGVIEDLVMYDDWVYPAKARADDRASGIARDGGWDGEVFFPPHRIKQTEVMMLAEAAAFRKGLEAAVEVAAVDWAERYRLVCFELCERMGIKADETIADSGEEAWMLVGYEATTKQTAAAIRARSFP